MPTFRKCANPRLGLAIALALAPVAGAPAAEIGAAGALEEITVTARKREETLQNVPIAVSAFSEAAIESIGVRSLEDVALRTPGVQYNEQAGQIPGRFNCSIRFRGMNVNSEQPVAQLGALFVDGIFVASGCSSLGAEDLARVEVVKGPQAVYFGRNTFGGAVNYVTKDPGNEWGGKVVASAAQGEDYEYTGSVEGPIVRDKLAFRVAARYYDRGDVFDITTNDGTEVGKQKTRSIATKLVFTPTEALTIKVRGQYAEDRDGPPASGFISGRLNDSCTGTFGPNGEARRNYICGMLPGANTVRTANANGNLFSYNTRLSPVSFTNRPNYLLTQLLENGANDPAIAEALALDYYGLKRNNTFLGGTADWNLPNGWTLSGVYGYNRMRSNWLRDFDLTDAEAWWSTDPQNLKDHTYELRVTSAQDQRLTWVLGVSKYRMEYTQGGNGGTVVTSIPGASPTARVPLTFANSLVNNVVQNYEAAFGGVTFRFTDQWSASLEARYQKDKLEKGQVIAAQLGRAPAVAEWSDLLPRAIVQWQPTAETNVYASYSKGVLPGDINAEYIFGPDNMRSPEQIESARQQIRNGATPYPELPGLANGSLGVPSAADFIDREELKSYEIGWKQQWLDGRIQTNVAVYSMRWKNQKGRLSVTIVDFNGNTNQPYVKDPASCGAGVRNSTDPVCNDTIRSLQFAVPGSSKLHGVEFESTVRATERLTLQLNVDYTKNEYTDFTFNFVEPLAGTRDMKGNSSPRYPEWKGNVGLSYVGAPIAGTNWSWFARGDLLYFGKYFVDESNLASAPAQTLLNARAGVTNGSIRVELFGNNLTDEDAYASASRWSDFTAAAVVSTANQGIAVAPQRPRYFGVRASYQF